MIIIAGKYKNFKLFTPNGLNTRPTSSRVRESLFNICQNMIEGAHFLDLFAGSGAIGFEALSRGAERVTFVDIDRESVKCIKKNIINIDVEGETEVYCSDVFKTLERLAARGKKFDIIYIDPPYSKNLGEGIKGLGQKVLEKIDTLDLLTTSGRVFIEEAQKALQANSNLATLALKDERSYGRSILHQYQNRGT